MNNISKILIVDDDSLILNSLKRILRNEPYTLFFAESGKEALHFLQQNTVEVILTDLRMPEMDGISLLKQVMKIYPDTISLVLSARGDACSIISAINDGNIYRYILKPWDNVELKIVIRQAVDLYNLRQDKKNLLKELEQYNLSLEKKVEEKTRQLMAAKNAAEIGKNTSQIVHNLNTPLNCILGSLDIAKDIASEQKPDLKEIEEVIGYAESGAEELGKIISEIMVTYRDKINFHTEKININNIIKKEHRFFETDPIYKNDIEKEVDLHNDLPEIEGNAIHIKQIVDNLISNAIDAMEYTIKKQLIIKTYMEKEKIVIQLSDSGEGISKSEISKIFLPEFTTKPVGKGTGLGLASVKAMVNEYHGEIRVESEKNKGATFTVILPLVQ